MIKALILPACARALFTALAIAVGGFILTPSVFAQANANPPERLAYQGYLVDANGTPLGTNATKNYDVIFRIWNDSSAAAPGNRLWTEQQTVTVDKGYFSVLLGEGSNIGETRNALSTVFNDATASERWVGITVKGIGPSSGDVNILPRLRLLTSPYAFLASKALSVDGAGLTSGTVPDSRLSPNVALLTNGTLLDARLSANVALLNRPVQTFSGGTNSFSGRVGIGTTTPQTTLHVAGSLAVDSQLNMVNAGILYTRNSSGANEPVFYPRWTDNATYLNYGVGGLSIRRNDNTVVLGADNAGNVGIGGPAQGRAKLEVIGESGINFVAPTWGSYYTGGFFGDPNYATAASFYGSSSIVGKDFLAFSDARVKSIQGRSDSAGDLQTLLSIEITDYRHKDVIAKGNAPQKKVIGQQLEKVFPQAVSKRTDVVPDIYQKATIKDGWVQLATKLKKGDRVRLIGEKKESIHAVLEVDERRFRTDFASEDNQVFVFGREVNDFRTVDYEAIAMLNVSATQELARKLAAKDAELTKLRAELTQLRTEKGALADKLAAVEARDQAREARLARLELALQETSAGPKASDQARGQTPGHTRELTSLTK